MEREEDKVWQAQLDIGGQIDAGIERILQLHLQEMFNVNTVGALPFFVQFCSRPCGIRLCLLFAAADGLIA